MTKLYKTTGYFLFVGLLLLLGSCERDLEELEEATFPSTAEVFIDAFSDGLEYEAFGGSDVTAFEVDTEVKYAGTSSMRFAIPDPDSPTGSYAGGIFVTEVGRDLSGYNVLTFWARASQPANLDEVGFGNDNGVNEHLAALYGVPMTTNWQKYYIPIPDPSKLTEERGMLFYSEAPEDGRGYTFWIDEVKFEKIGTIVSLGSRIFDGEDRLETVETGTTFTVEGEAVFSLPNGVERSVFASPAYFEYFSSESRVATVDGTGNIMVLDAGTTKITAALNGQESTGSLEITSTGDPILPDVAAPTPTVSADSVISIFSNAYDDEPVDYFNGFWEFSTANTFDVQVDGDDIKRYTDLNFVGIQFTAPTLDVTRTNRFHMDIWTPDATDPPAEFKILLFDIGPDLTFGTEDDSSHEVVLTSPTLQSNAWVSLDFSFAEFPGLTSRAHLAQIVLSGNIPNVFVDNIYFYEAEEDDGSGLEPMVAAPTPTQSEASVVSLFSDAYTDVPVDTWRTPWSAATFEDVLVDNNPTKKYTGLDFVGIETVANPVDASAMTHIHLDVWSGNFTFFGIKLVDFGADGAFGGGDDVEFQINYEMPEKEQWVSYDIPLSDFVDLTTRSNIGQYILVAQPSGGATLFVDNMYFYDENGGGGGATEPTMAAPTPTVPEGAVVSLFSDAYTDVTVDTWRTDWSAATFEDVLVDGNPTKKYSDLDFVGIETQINPVDASAATHLHLDVWSADFTFFGIKLVDFGADGVFGGGDDVEHQINFDTPQQSEWIGYDIPLADFTGLTTRSNLAQYILVAQPPGNATIFVDNMYFYNENGGGNATEPTMAAPAPTLPAENVISIFSDAYDDVMVDTWRTDWSSATFEDVTIADNATKKYSDLDFVGIESTTNTVDVSTMTHIHLDVWSADYSFFGIKLVDFGADASPGGGDDTEFQVNFDMPAQGEWVSLDIPLTEFTDLMNRMNIAQYILVGQPTGTTTVFVDNIYFHN